MTANADWVRDERGAWRRATIPHMGRRLPGFDYGQRRIYEITVVLEERRPVLGRLVSRSPVAAKGEGGAGCGQRWAVEPTAAGEVVLACWREIPQRWPQVELIEGCLMPDHFHGILFVKEHLPKGHTLGSIIGGFKAGCTIGWRSSTAYGRGSGECSAGYGRGPECPAPAAMAAGVPRWAEGFVDVILFGKGQLARMIAYLRDNPRRLAIKRANPTLFRVRRAVTVDFQSPIVAPWSGPGSGSFAAIGNDFLLTRPDLRQVQCSRRFFAYARDAAGRPLKDAPPAVSTPEFDAKLEAAISAAHGGAVIVSPCISEGEREISRRVFADGGRVIALQNMGFSPLYKPGGRLFECCAAGNLLLLAPAAWRYQPAKKAMTRRDAQTLNRIAQLIAGEGAVEIDYKGVVLSNVDAGVSMACSHDAKEC